MKIRSLLACSALLFSGVAAAAQITGAGATFPYPLYAKWASAYKTETGNGVNLLIPRKLTQRLA
jgi:phosphate transport system substrate-binding protein